MFDGNPLTLVYILMVIIFLVFIRGLFKSYLSLKRGSSDILIGNAQSKGKRKNQEDSFSTIKNENGSLALIADGMGGLYYGKKASNIVVKTFLEEFSRVYNIESINKFLINSTYISNAKILEVADGVKIGTTIVGALVDNNNLHWISVGDSHIYLYRDKRLTLLNNDHIYGKNLKEAYRRGDISRDEMLSNPKKGQLTSYLGYEEFHEIDYSKEAIPLRKSDKILLCSDGVYNALSQIDLEKILAKRVHPLETSEIIINNILNKEIANQDNATVIVMEKRG